MQKGTATTCEWELRRVELTPRVTDELTSHQDQKIMYHNILIRKKKINRIRQRERKRKEWVCALASRALICVRASKPNTRPTKKCVQTNQRICCYKIITLKLGFWFFCIASHHIFIFMLFFFFFLRSSSTSSAASFADQRDPTRWCDHVVHGNWWFLLWFIFGEPGAVIRIAKLVTTISLKAMDPINKKKKEAKRQQQEERNE